MNIFSYLLITVLFIGTSLFALKDNRHFSEERSLKDTLLVTRLNDVSQLYDAEMEIHPCYKNSYSTLEGLRCVGTAKLKLFRKGKSEPFQMISTNLNVSETSPKYATFPLSQLHTSTFTSGLLSRREPGDFLRFVDLNADSQADMIIQNELDYSAYAYDSLSQKFIYDEAFSDILRFASSYLIDEKNRTLTVDYYYLLRSVCSKRKKYRLDNKPILIKEIVKMPYQDYTRSSYNEITRELIDGKWVESIKKIGNYTVSDESADEIEHYEILDASKRFRVLIDLPCAFLEPVWKRGGWGGRFTKIKLLTQGGKVFQVLKAYTAENYEFEFTELSDSNNDGYTEVDVGYAPITFIGNMDFNFDGIDDVAIRVAGKVSYYSSGPTYDVYLYSKERNQFVFSPEFSDIWTEYTHLSTDAITKTINVYTYRNENFPDTILTTSVKMIDNKPKPVKFHFQDKFYYPHDNDSLYNYKLWMTDLTLEGGHWKSRVYIGAEGVSPRFREAVITR